MDPTPDPTPARPDLTRSVVEDNTMRPNGEPNDRTPDPTTDPTPPPDAVPILIAAQRLGLTSDAIRMRLKRGTLTGHKVDGRWVVHVPPLNADQTATRPPPDAGAAATDRQTQRPTERDQTVERELIDTLRSENAYLRDELAVRTEEIRRRDHIIAGFLERLPELPAMTDASARTTQHEHVNEPVEILTPAHETRPWWKRALGIT